MISSPYIMCLFVDSSTWRASFWTRFRSEIKRIREKWNLYLKFCRHHDITLIPDRGTMVIENSETFHGMVSKTSERAHITCSQVEVETL